ncbi:MAG TPA: HD domain-containing protein [Egibacteraceae bacterium]|nr:HD domain-containing protein [Egibacteraceae bacterium]
MSERETIEPILTERFDEAYVFASELHRWQLRKGTAVPYLSHLLAVASLVLEDGGDEDEAIAALLHDAVEDQGGVATLNEIRRRFGERVADMVLQATDHDPARDRPAWHVRKKAYVAALPERHACHRVVLADKLHNARSILADYRRVGDQVWLRFSAGREVLGYLRALADMFTQISASALAVELDHTVAELERLDRADARRPTAAGV